MDARRVSEGASQKAVPSLFFLADAAIFSIECGKKATPVFGLLSKPALAALRSAEQQD
jgi:hypothetical protein